ncbi:MAG: helix-turn-helix domain-containing protein [Kiritimatiellales bacterium]
MKKQRHSTAEKAKVQEPKVPIYKIQVPIAEGRAGLIRCMDSRSAEEKPNERFTYNVLSLIVIESGNATYMIDNQMIDLMPLSAIWCFPDYQRTLCHRTPDLKMWVISFTPDFLRQTCLEPHDTVLKSRREEILYRHLRPGEFRFLSTVFNDLLNTGEPCAAPLLGTQGENDRFHAGLHYILQHIWYIFRTTKDERRHEELHPAVAKAVHLICNDDHGISIGELARQCNISESRIYPLFKREIGMTITEFRNRQKLERVLLHYSPKGRKSLMTCAIDAGFGSYSQFYNVFKKSTGKSPKEYFG